MDQGAAELCLVVEQCLLRVTLPLYTLPRTDKRRSSRTIYRGPMLYLTTSISGLCWIQNSTADWTPVPIRGLPSCCPDSCYKSKGDFIRKEAFLRAKKKHLFTGLIPVIQVVTKRL